MFVRQYLSVVFIKIEVKRTICDIFQYDSINRYYKKFDCTILSHESLNFFKVFFMIKLG